MSQLMMSARPAKPVRMLRPFLWLEASGRFVSCRLRPLDAKTRLLRPSSAAAVRAAAMAPADAPPTLRKSRPLFSLDEDRCHRGPWPARCRRGTQA